MSGNIFYAQSGGVTPVINATACGVIETARKSQHRIGKVYAGLNGIVGALEDNIIDTTCESDADIAKLRYTPAGAFGSCRHKLPDPNQDMAPYNKLFETFKKHNIEYFFYNGGGDSQDTTHKISEIAKKLGYPLKCIGLPKTIDNDLPITDNCPGFGSVAKYVAVSIKEAGLDIASMAKTSTKFFVMEVMGRHTGWIAAAAGLSSLDKEGLSSNAPHIILFPEVPFDQDKFLAKTKECTEKFGFCVVVVSEGLKDKSGNLIQKQAATDSFGHAQLGGIAPYIANMVTSNLGYKNHWAVCDYLQRAARHIASKTDVDQAYALGEQAVLQALEGKTDIMLTIERVSSSPYKWQIGQAPLASVANIEKDMPEDFFRDDGFHISQKCVDYLLPLIQGEDYPKYNEFGLPDYVKLKNILLK